jgi:DNA-binding transcriptional MocR family regulator
MYRQLFDQVVERIRNGTYPPGFRLPPTRQLAVELGAHRNTVVRAYEDLEAAGFVDSTVGRGTFVAESRLPRVSAATSGPAASALPWASLVSNAVGVEALGRSERLGRNPPPGAVNLARMQPSEDLIPEELFRRCLDHVLRSVGAKALSYPPRDGLPRLRELIAEDLRRQGVPASAEDLIITTGSQQGLDLIARALINPGDPFLVDESTYAGAINLLSVAGARLVGIPVGEDGPDMDSVRRHARGAKGFYLMPECQNPLGTRISIGHREALVAWSREAGVPLIEDDFASELYLDDQPRLPSLRALDGDVIHVGTYSKKLIPALRIGYVLCPRELHRHIGALKHAMDLGNSTILQHALAEFLDRGYLRAHLGHTLPEYRRRRDALVESLRRHLPAGVTWRHPEAGLQLWLPVPPELDPEVLYAEALRQGVVVTPGLLNGIGATPRRGVRLTFCSEPPERLIEGGKRLGKAWAVVARQAGTAGARLETV